MLVKHKRFARINPCKPFHSKKLNALHEHLIIDILERENVCVCVCVCYNFILNNKIISVNKQ